MLAIYYNKSKNTNLSHPENHDRITTSINFLKENLSTTDIQIYNGNQILKYLQNHLELGTKEEIADIILTQIYSENYINNIKEMTSELEEGELIEGDTYFSNVTFNEILDNSVILYNVCYQIVQQNIKYGYCLIRPPSHHSSLNRYNGFCIVNHTYLTAKYLHDKYNKKILILDYDVHHGDGTQALVKEHLEDEVYFVSMHCYGNGFYPGTGDINENNEKVLNIPMKRGTGDELYLERFNEVKDYINSKEIDIIIISNGLDAHHADPFGVMYLTNKFYVKVTEYLKSLDKPLIYILEGGYNPNTIGKISLDIIKELTNEHDSIEFENLEDEDDD
jgi:acetoin utilization deacetylase AcuC-like enzyme